MSAANVINDALKANTAQIGIVHATNLFNQEYACTDKVTLPLSQRNKELLIEMMDGVPIIFTPDKNDESDHPLFTAARELIRLYFERDIRRPCTGVEVLVFGGTPREYSTHHTKSNFKFYFGNKDIKDVQRITMNSLALIAKRLSKRNPPTQTVRSRITNIETLIGKLTASGEMPGNIVLKPTPAGVILFEDSIYNLTGPEICDLFEQTGASMGFGYMCLPFDLFINMPPDATYDYRCISVDGVLTGFLNFPGGSLGYNHPVKAWRTLYDNVLTNGRISIVVEWGKRIGCMINFRLYKAHVNQIVSRIISIPHYLRFYNVLDIWASVNHASCTLKSPLVYNPIRCDEWDELINYLYRLDDKSCDYKAAQGYLCRRKNGVSLYNTTLETAKHYDYNKIVPLAYTAVVYTTFMKTKYTKAISKLGLGSSFQKFLNCFKSAMSIIFFPITEIIDWLRSENLQDALVVTPMQFEKFTYDKVRVTKAKHWAMKPDTDQIEMTPIDSVIQGTDEGKQVEPFDITPEEGPSYTSVITPSSKILTSEIINDEEKLSLIKKKVKSLDYDYDPERLVKNNRYSVIYPTECWLCEKIKDQPGQVIVCNHHKSVKHTFKTTTKEMQDLVAEFADTDRDENGIKRVKEAAKPLVPKTGFEHTVDIYSITGGPGCGKSHTIRYLYEKLENAAVVAPFSRLMSAYAEIIKGRKIVFKTNHRAFHLVNIENLFVDEASAFDYRFLACIARNCGAKRVILVGDPRQTRILPSEGICIYDKIDTKRIPNHHMRLNFRNPIKHVLLLNYLFGYDMIPVSKTFDIPIKFLTTADVNQFQNFNQLFFSTVGQSIYDLEENPAKKKTVRASQGCDFEDVALYVVNSDYVLTKIESLNIVALSRHKRNLYVITDPSNPAIEYISELKQAIQKVTDDLDDVTKTLPTIADTRIEYAVDNSTGKITSPMFADSTLTCSHSIPYKFMEDRLIDIPDQKFKIGAAQGQRKLYLTDMNFLRRNYTGQDDTIVVIGAAPGTHFVDLIKHYPAHWMLFDPRQFDKSLLDLDIAIINREYVPDDYKLIPKSTGKLLMICDIRTDDLTPEGITKDHLLQQEILLKLKPDHASLKFCPQFDKETDTFTYLRGHIQTQLWARIGTLETRLFIDAKKMAVYKPQTKLKKLTKKIDNKKFEQLIDEFEEEIGIDNKEEYYNGYDTDEIYKKKDYIDTMVLYNNFNRAAVYDETVPVCYECYHEYCYFHGKTPTSVEQVYQTSEKISRILNYSKNIKFAESPFNYPVDIVYGNWIEFITASKLPPWKKLEEISDAQFLDHVEKVLPLGTEPVLVVKKTDIIDIPKGIEHAPKDAYKNFEQFILPEAQNSDLLMSATNNLESRIVKKGGGKTKVNIEMLVCPVNNNGHPIKNKPKLVIASPGEGKFFTHTAPLVTCSTVTGRYDTEYGSRNVTATTFNLIQDIVGSYTTVFYAQKKMELMREETFLSIISNAVVEDIQTRHYYNRWLGTDDADADLVRFHVKSIFKPNNTFKDFDPLKNPYTKKAENQFKVGQGVSAASVDVNSALMFVCRIIQIVEKILTNDTLEHIAMTDTHKDNYEFAREVTQMMHKKFGQDANVKFSVSDATEFDASQGPATRTLVAEYLITIGFPKDFVLMFLNTLDGVTIVANGITSGTNKQTSGNLWTLFINSTIVKLIKNYITRNDGVRFLVYKGDDSLMIGFGLGEIETRVKRVKEVLGLQFKSEVLDYGEFCGQLITKDGMMPNLYRKLVKLVSHRYVNVAHWQEYQQSLHDYLVYVETVGLNSVIKATALLLDLSFDQATEIYHVLKSFRSISAEQFLEIAHEEVERDYIPVMKFGQLKFLDDF